MTRTVLLSLSLLLLSTPAWASEFALQRWLDEPDVKLVAVEFYADWCEPCKKAAPRWEALRKKYASQGLKLVVVNIGEDARADGGCSQLPWSPDESLCDRALGEQLGVKKLPEAFVWSWQGNLLVDRGRHVGAIEEIIRGYLDDNPRVQVVATGLGGAPDPALQRTVEERLTDSGKLTVVPDREMRRRLDRVRKESHQAGRRDDQRCDLGAEVSPNSLLRVERFEGSLSMTLVDAATSCQRATATAPWHRSRPDKAVRTASFKLMNQLKRSTVQMPGERVARSAPTPRPVAAERAFRSEAKRWEMPESQTATVAFSSSPAGAVVLVDGKMVCQDTSKRCRKMLAPGPHEVTMEKEGYLRRSERVDLEDGDTISWDLDPDFGWLTVESEPAGLRVTINGEAVGTTPTTRTRYPPGEYSVVVSDARYYEAGEVVVVEREEEERVSVRLEPRQGGVDIVSVDAQGNATEATVFIDGQEVGETPYRAKMLIGEHRVEVRHEEYGLARETVEVEEAKVARVALKLDRELSVELKVRDAMASASIPKCELEDGTSNARSRRSKEQLHSYTWGGAYIGMLIQAPYLFMGLEWALLEEYDENDALWTGYFITTAVGHALIPAGIVGLASTQRESTEWSLALTSVILGGILYLGAHPLFGTLINEGRREACYRKKLSGGASACAQPRAPEPPSFTLAPMVMPTPSGKTAYGLSGGFNF